MRTLKVLLGLFLCRNFVQICYSIQLVELIMAKYFFFKSECWRYDAIFPKIFL